MIEIRKLSKAYGANQVLSDVDVRIERGEFVALLGPNGAGKSTLMHCILGITGYEGMIRVNGLDPATQGKRVRAQIGYMPQGTSLHTDLTVAQTMQFYAEFLPNAVTSPAELLREVGLYEVRDRRVGELSGGMQQRLSFAVARLHDPAILLLDEPSASLDRGSRQFMLSALRELANKGTTVVLSTHLSNELAELVDRFLLLEDAQLSSIDPRANADVAVPAIA